MTPELEAVLDRIGWQRTKAIAPDLAYLADAFLCENGGLAAPNSAVAKSAAVAVEELLLTARHLSDGLAALNGAARGQVNVGCAMSQDSEAIDWPDYVGETLKALHVLEPGLELLRARLVRQGSRSKTGKPRNDAAHKIAYYMTMIYFVGKSRLPPFSIHPITGEPNGDFTPSVSEAFQLLGLGAADPIGPCRAARKALSKGRRMAILEEYRTGRAVNKRLGLGGYATLMGPD